MKRLVTLLLLFFLSTHSFAETFINTTGSDDRTAISGFDTVAYFTEKKASPGKPEFEFNYHGAKWLFSSQENLNLFQKNPEKYMPEWGGQCAWGVSENGLSKKKINSGFELINGKLYLFSFGNTSENSAQDDFMYGRWRASRRIPDGDKNWPELKKKLEDGILIQPNSSNYKKTRFE